MVAVSAVKTSKKRTKKQNVGEKQTIALNYTASAKCRIFSQALIMTRDSL